MIGHLARIPGRATVAAIATGAVALVAASAGSGAPPALKQKEAQYQAVTAQISALGVQLGRIAESYDGARYRLGQIQASRRRNGAALAEAKKGYRVAEQHAADRLVAVYESGEPSTADALLGATSLNDMLDRLAAVDSAAAYDRRLSHQVASLRNELTARAQALAIARQQQAQTVSQLAAQRQQHAAALKKLNTLRASIQTQLSKLQAAERVRQQRLLVEARARLVRQQLAQAAQAAANEARARAEQEKAAAAAAAAQQAAAAKQATTTAAAADPPPPPTTTVVSPTTPAAPATTTAPTATVAPPTSTPSAGAGHPQAATIALNYLGVPYLWGGSTPRGFDCSGLVMYVYAQLGVALPHYAAAQYGLGVPVDRSALQPGDLVFFDGLNHVGIWIGGNQFVDAPQTGDVVKIETLSSWYADHYVGARRI